MTESKHKSEGMPAKETWGDGHYVLTVDRFTTVNREDFRRGDVLRLDEGEAIRLGNGGAIAPVGSIEACRSQVSAIEDDDERRIQTMLLDADELEERARQLRGRANGVV